MSACSIELPDNVQRGRPVESRGPGVARSSGSGRWGCEIEEPASTRPAEVRGRHLLRSMLAGARLSFPQ